MGRYKVRRNEIFQMQTTVDYIINANSERDAIEKLQDGDYIEANILTEDYGDMLDFDIESIEEFFEIVDNNQKNIAQELDSLIEWYFKFASMVTYSENTMSYNIEKITFGDKHYAFMEIFEGTENQEKGRFAIYYMNYMPTEYFDTIPDSWVKLTDKEMYDKLQLLRTMYIQDTKIVVHEEPYGLYYDLINDKYHKGRITIGYTVDENGKASYWDDSLNLSFTERLSCAYDVYGSGSVEILNNKSIIYANSVIESYRKNDENNND